MPRHGMMVLDTPKPKYERKLVALPVVMTGRPRKRGECPPQRPCPYVGCRYHLYTEVSIAGSLFVRPGEPWDCNPSCALDVAESGPHKLDEVGRILNVSRERVRQIEERALAKIRAIGIDPDVLTDLLAGVP